VPIRHRKLLTGGALRAVAGARRDGADIDSLPFLTTVRASVVRTGARARVGIPAADGASLRSRAARHHAGIGHPCVEDDGGCTGASLGVRAAFDTKALVAAALLVLLARRSRTSGTARSVVALLSSASKDDSDGDGDGRSRLPRALGEDHARSIELGRPIDAKDQLEVTLGRARPSECSRKWPDLRSDASYLRGVSYHESVDARAHVLVLV
jgi:hypothetical protein